MLLEQRRNSSIFIIQQYYIGMAHSSADLLALQVRLLLGSSLFQIDLIQEAEILAIYLPDRIRKGSKEQKSLGLILHVARKVLMQAVDLVNECVSSVFVILCTQGNIKRDPQGYSDEFFMQWRHYLATFDLFLLAPSQASPSFSDLVAFISHVASCYPEDTEPFPGQLMQLLETHASVMDPSVRMAIVKALILMHNKGSISSIEIIPMLFRLFRVADKSLRTMVFRHITANIKNANRKGRNDRLNRAIQNYLYSVMEEEHEATAKKGLAVLTEMWRRQIWRDARTVNVVASAVFHPSPRISLAALKFFLGQDDEEDAEDSDDEDVGGGKMHQKGESANRKVPVGPSQEEIYRAFHKGTSASKKRKQKKLKRVMASVKRATRREEGSGQESFAALQLLHDPQGFADELLSKLRSGSYRFESRLTMMMVLSRVIGVHKLLVLNFYPFLQRYIAPSQRDVTVLLAGLVQSCHELVPPDALAPVLRQLADQFIHDRARPEVMTVGLKTVREICIRSPLVMTPELLQDLIEYRKFRDKEVATSARALLGLFRELAPGMLAKKDRGRGADLNAVPVAYGATKIAHRVEGADLLEEALRSNRIVDGEVLSSDDNDRDGGSDGDDSAALEAGSEKDEEEERSQESDVSVTEEEEDVEDDFASNSDVREFDDDSSSREEEEKEEESDVDDGTGTHHIGKKRKIEPNKESLSALKKRLAKAGENQQQGGEKDVETEQDGFVRDDLQQAQEKGVTAENPLEWGRILTQEDFDAIRQLRYKRLVATAMAKHGLKSASKASRAREAAEEEAEELLELQEQLGTLHERRVAPSALLGKRRGRRDKEERMASVLEGREGREFGAKARLKKDKTGGLSNKEKAKRKNLPAAAKMAQAKRRMQGAKKRSSKNFKGHRRS